MASDPSGASSQSAPDQTLKPDQALAVIGMGLLQKLAAGGNDLPWIWSDGDEAQTDLAALRQRLELTRLAIDTGAPLSTAEVSGGFGGNRFREAQSDGFARRF
jgi:hypothetical protein